MRADLLKDFLKNILRNLDTLIALQEFSVQGSSTAASGGHSKLSKAVISKLTLLKRGLIKREGAPFRLLQTLAAYLNQFKKNPKNKRWNQCGKTFFFTENLTRKRQNRETQAGTPGKGDLILLILSNSFILFCGPCGQQPCCSFLLSYLILFY